MLDRARTCEKEQHEIISSMLEKGLFPKIRGEYTLDADSVILNSTNHAFVLLNAVSHFQLDIPTKELVNVAAKHCRHTAEKANFWWTI